MARRRIRINCTPHRGQVCSLAMPEYSVGLVLDMRGFIPAQVPLIWSIAVAGNPLLMVIRPDYPSWALDNRFGK